VILQFQVVFVILGHNIKTVESPVPLESPASKASHWSIREKMRHFEVNALDRTTLFEPFVHLSSKLNQPPNKSGFHQLRISRKSIKADS
jgi:NF-kappa-B inhibitor-interacting Ras-like protein